jgi:hypothetical protein
MGKVSPQATSDHFIGSGALEYSWWEVGASHGIAQLDSPDDWYVDLIEVEDADNEEYGVTVRVDHKEVLKAVNKLARTAKDNRPEHMNPDVLRECSKFIKDPDDADFDADAADQVLQYIAFGKVIYG